MSRINEKYDVIDTYPNLIGVPKAASDEFIKQVASFRSRARLPVSVKTVCLKCRFFLSSLLSLHLILCIFGSKMISE